MGNEIGTASIILEFESDEADAFSQLGFTKKRRRHRKFFWIQMLVFLVVGIICYFAFGGFEEDAPKDKNIWNLVGAVVIALIFLVFSFLIEVLVPMYHEVFLVKEKNLKKEYSGQWVFRARPEGLLVVYGKREELIGWERMGETEADDDYLYLRLDKGEHLILPRNKVVTGDYEKFVYAVMERINS